MANSILTADIVLKEFHRKFKNNTAFLGAIDKQYDDSYKSHGAKAGDTIRIKQPQRLLYRTGKTVDVQPMDENSVDLPRTSQAGVDLRFSSKEKTLDITDFSRIYLGPAVSTIVSNMELAIMTTAYQQVSNCVTLPTGGVIDSADILDAGVLLDNGSCPRDGMERSCIVNPLGQADLAGATSTVFNPSRVIGKQYLSGQMGEAYGFNFGMCQNIPTHTTGSYDGAYVCDGAGVEGASELDVKTGTGTFTLGDAFSIANVNSVNRLTGESTGRPQVFRVTTAEASGGSVTLAIAPSLTTVGAYRTIDALPVGDAAITEIGTASTAYPQNMAFHKSFAAFGTCDLEIPKSNIGGLTGRSVEDGISIRMVEFYDGVNDDTYVRFDILYGFVVVVPEFAARIYGV